MKRISPHPSFFIFLDPFGLHPGGDRRVVRAGVAAGDIAIAVAIPLHHLLAQRFGGCAGIGVVDLHDIAGLKIEVKAERRVGLCERGTDLCAVIRCCHSLDLPGQESVRVYVEPLRAAR